MVAEAEPGKTFKAFLCHSSKDYQFVTEVAKHLKRNLLGVFYYEEHQRSDEPFVRTINEELVRCNVAVIFVGRVLGDWQVEEAAAAHRLLVDGRTEGMVRYLFVVLLPGARETPSSISMLGGYPRFRAEYEPHLGDEAYRIAKEIVDKLGHPWRSEDDLPLDPHLFSYEKDTIRHFTEKADLEVRISSVRSKLEGSKRDEPEHEKLRDEYRQLERDYRPFREKQLNGCPAAWPEVTHWKGERENSIPEREIGALLHGDARVVAAALSAYHHPEGTQADVPPVCMTRLNLCFPEARPRKKLLYPINNDLRVAILVSGGIAPGINAVINAINQRHHMYASCCQHEVLVYGLRNGFYAFDDFGHSHYLLATRQDRFPHQPELVTTEHAGEGGSILGTSRVDRLLKTESRSQSLDNIVHVLSSNHIDILYIIGGDGSMKAAHAIWNYARRHPDTNNPTWKLSVVAIPKTMDNDILWVWQSFGFLSAVEEARKVIENLATEVKSNPRLAVVQLFGSDSGFVVSHAVLASRTGICDAALIPEIAFSLNGLVSYLKRKIGQRMTDEGGSIPYGLVVMAETAIPTDAKEYLEEPAIGLSDDEKAAIRDFERLRERNKRIEGQTNDFLRSAGLKIMSRGLQKELGRERGWDKMRVFTNEPRHLLRAISPSCSDIIFGHRLGTLAVDNAMAGYTDFMISQWLTEYVLVPLKLVALGRKRIPKQGIFWKSVLAKTGQPADL